MSFLEVQHYTGDIERRPLHKQSSLTIGSHASCDLRIDDEAVEVLHCRISWGKQGFEAVAAGVEPLDHNGTQVRRATLKAGDVLRFGAVDVKYREGEGEAEPAEEPGELLGLKPIEETPRRRPAAPPTRVEIPQSPIPPKRGSRPPEEDLDPNDFLSALDMLASESVVESAQPAEKKRRSSQPLTRGPAPELSPASEREDVAPAAVNPPVVATPRKEDGLSDRMRQAMHARQTRRPGDEDILRSPLVLGLGGGAIVLLLATAIFYFIGYRQTTQQRFDAARTEFDAGNYITAIKAFDEFLNLHPRDPLSNDARRTRGAAEVLQQISGAAPNFPEGLKKLRAFIENQRDLGGFEQLTPDLTEYSKTIALGAATTAGRVFDPALLEVSNQAKSLLQSYLPKGAGPSETIQQIETAYRNSEAAILRDDVFKDHISRMSAALTAKQPRDALRVRRDLLVRYPQFASDRKLVEQMSKTLLLERELSPSLEWGHAPVREDHPGGPPVITLAFQGRTRTDELPVGKAVVATGGESVFGVEFVTGQPLWRRVTGPNRPFFPILDDRTSGIILCDTNRQELLLLDQATGKLKWRLPLASAISGKPLLASDGLYVPLQSGALLAVEMQTGEARRAIQFTQPVSGPVEISNEQRLVVAGRDEVLYILTKRPFAVEAVHDLGHAAGSIRAPLLSMASYLLAIENGDKQARAHLLQVAASGTELTEVATQSVAGRVLDEAVIRGRDLFVPFSGEGVAAFALSDDAGQPPLTAGPTYVGKGKQEGSAYLLAGPERQLWMATGALLRLRLSTDSLQPESEPSAIGFASQPLKYMGGYLFHGRRRPYSQGVTLTRTDRDTLTSDWQVVVSSPILAVAGRATGNGLNLVAVNDAGQAFRLSDRQLGSTPFLAEPASRLPLHADLIDPLLASAVNGDRLAVVCGGPEPRLWLINSAGQIESSITLPALPEAAPVLIENEIVVPLQGRLHVIRQAGRPPVQELLLPTGTPAHWLNVVATGTRQAAGLLREGVLLNLRLTEGAQPGLEEKARVELGAAARYPLAAAEGMLAVADHNQRVSVFDSQQLEPRGAKVFQQGVAGPPRLAGQRVFVEEGDQLHCLRIEQDLPTQWSLPLTGARVTEITQAGDQFMIGLRSGEVLRVTAASGEIQQRNPLGAPLEWGPRPFGSSQFAGTRDGSLIQVP